MPMSGPQIRIASGKYARTEETSGALRVNRPKT